MSVALDADTTAPAEKTEFDADFDVEEHPDEATLHSHEPVCLTSGCSHH